MRVLQLHNKYLQYGGEDSVVNNEFKLLREGGVPVKQLTYENSDITINKMFFNKNSHDRALIDIRSFKPSVLHVHNIFYKATPSVLYAAKKEKVPTVMTLHNFRLMCPGALFLRNGQVCTKCKDLVIPYHGVVHKCFKESYSKSLALSTFLAIQNLLGTWKNKVDCFIVLTPFIKELIVSSGLNIDQNRIIVKPNSTDDFLDDHSTGLRNGYLYVGRLSKEKGVETMVKAFNNMPDKKLEIVGTGDLEQNLKEVAKDNIVFHGMKDRKFIKQKLNESKALIFPSIWYEGLPNTIIESFSSGTPVLASDIENVNGIVINNYNGKTFKVGSAQRLEEVVNNFDDTSNYQLSMNARKTFEEKYTHQKNLEELKRIYENLIL